jgi:quercetin dioxygenase-like cupin family protein
MSARGLLMTLALASVALTAGLAAQDGMHHQAYPQKAGELLIDNDRIVVQKFVFQPGESEGPHTHPGNQLLVYIKGGVWTWKPTARSTRWKDGAVVWQNAVTRADDHAGETNTGPSPIELLWVTLKPTPPRAAAARGMPAKDLHVNYPNIPGEDVLENDLVIVQRFVVNPGEWEGVHEHPGNQLYVHIKDGKWEVKSNVPRPPRPAGPPAANAADRPALRTSGGSIGWYPAHPLSEEHQSGNVGPEPIDLIWITLKR